MDGSVLMMLRRNLGGSFHVKRGREDLPDGAAGGRPWRVCPGRPLWAKRRGCGSCPGVRPYCPRPWRRYARPNQECPAPPSRLRKRAAAEPAPDRLASEEAQQSGAALAAVVPVPCRGACRWEEPLRQRRRLVRAARMRVSPSARGARSAVLLLPGRNVPHAADASGDDSSRGPAWLGASPTQPGVT
jgi:hypothetical protein